MSRLSPVSSEGVLVDGRLRSVGVQYFPMPIPFDVQRLDVPNIALRFFPNLFSLRIDENKSTAAIETNDYG